MNTESVSGWLCLFVEVLVTNHNSKELYKKRKETPKC